MSHFPALSLLILIPLAGAALAACLGKERLRLARGLALLCAGAALVFAGALWLRFNPASAAMQFVEQHSWIPSLGVAYHLGIDGLGLMLLLLTALVTLMALLAPGAPGAPLYYALILFLQAGLFGVFTALNFFHWFLFWELSLIPAFFLVKLWGGEGRSPAAIQFFLYTMLGSVAMLLGFVALYLASGTWEFDALAELSRSGQLAAGIQSRMSALSLFGAPMGTVIFACVFLGFAVKIPIVPFHAWLPSTYAAAPAGVAMLLTGAMSKMGAYGLLRILAPIFPEQMRALLTPLLWLAIATIVFSAGAALAQRDIKRMLAYSSINHLGYCVLGVVATASATEIAPRWDAERAAALSGVMLQMFNHGVTASALFCFVALLEERSGGRRGINDFGGLRQPAPVFCGLMGTALFASLGLPGLNGFVGEFLIFKGVFALSMWAAVLSTAGLLLTALFLLLLLQRVFWGPLNPRWSGVADLSGKEKALMAPAVALMLILGIFPGLLLQLANQTALALVERLRF